MIRLICQRKDLYVHAGLAFVIYFYMILLQHDLKIYTTFQMYSIIFGSM